MVGAAGTTTTTPLRLKDLLELDCDSCSAAGFQCYPRRLLGEPSAPSMRRLLASQPSLRRRPTKKLSHLSRSLSRRLLSKGALFRRRQDEDDDEDDACAAEAAPSGGGSESSGASSSSSSSSSETTTTSDNSSGRRGSRCESDSDFSTATSTSSSATSDDTMDAAAPAVNHDTTRDDQEAMKRSGSSSGSEPDDKEEQLSPVAVMDFPSDDDDGERDVAGACSPSFSLARLQRRKMVRPQHKIRRFGSTEERGPVVDLETLMAATSDSDSDTDDNDIVQELGPVDLETLMAATSSDSDTDDIADDDVVAQQQVSQRRTGDAAATTAPRPSIRNNCHGAGVVVHDETHEHGLLHLLMDAASACVDHVSEQLLFDFFVEMKRRRRGSTERSDDSRAGWLLPREDERWLGDGEVLAAARGWLDDGAGGERRWGLNDVLRRGGEAVVAEMERPRRWMQVGEEEREVGAVVAGMLADQLVDEMLWDLLV